MSLFGWADLDLIVNGAAHADAIYIMSTGPPFDLETYVCIRGLDGHGLNCSGKTG